MRYFLVVIAFVLLLFGSSCSGTSYPIMSAPPSPTPSSSATTSSIEDAIRGHLAQEGIAYVGNCVTADIRTDIGKYCSSITLNSEDKATAIIGPTFSEYVSTLSLTRTDEGWVVTNATPIQYPDPFLGGGATA